MTFDSRVGNASLVCTRTHDCLILRCDIASDASHSHSLINLHLSGAVLFEFCMREKRRKKNKTEIYTYNFLECEHD